jgi:hypothetical protein
LDAVKKHQYVVGFGLVLIGVLGIAGTITGSLAAMLAALFDPSILTAPGSSLDFGPVISGPDTGSESDTDTSGNQTISPELGSGTPELGGSTTPELGAG